MMQSEFEEMIGKEVDSKTYEIYEQMYVAAGLPKQEFVKLLDISIIPESERAIKAKEESEKIRNGWKAEIEESKAIIKELQEEKTFYKKMENWCLEGNDKEGAKGWKRRQSNKNADIRDERNRINELKWLLSV